MYKDFIKHELAGITASWCEFIAGLTPEQKRNFDLCLREQDRAEGHIRKLAEESGQSSISVSVDGGALCHVQVNKTLPKEVTDELLTKYAFDLDAIGCLRETHRISIDYRKLAKKMDSGEIDDDALDMAKAVLDAYNKNLVRQVNSLHIADVDDYIHSRYFRGMLINATDGGYDMTGLVDTLIEELNAVRTTLKERMDANNGGCAPEQQEE